MEKKPVWDSEPGVAELINEHKVDVLWDLGWEKITAGFKAECLRKLLVKIREVKDRIVAVKACLCHYRYYLIGLDHEQYVECWDGGWTSGVVRCCLSLFGRWMWRWIGWW